MSTPNERGTEPTGNTAPDGELGRDPAPDRAAADPAPAAAPAAAAAPLPETSGTPAPPVPEPNDPRAARELAALMFKPALDAGRRIAPAPGPVLATPRPGTAPQLPIAYGARAIPTPAVPPPPTAPAQGSATFPTPAAPREPARGRVGQPSLARQNRRFRRIALGGGAAVLLGTAAGIWALARLAASWL